MFVRSFLSKKGQKGTRNPGQEGRGTTAKGSGLTNSGDSRCNVSLFTVDRGAVLLVGTNAIVFLCKGWNQIICGRKEPGSSVYTVTLIVYTVTFIDAEYQAKLGNSFGLNTGLHIGMIQSHLWFVMSGKVLRQVYKVMSGIMRQLEMKSRETYITTQRKSLHYNKYLTRGIKKRENEAVFKATIKTN